MTSASRFNAESARCAYRWVAEDVRQTEDDVDAMVPGRVYACQSMGEQVDGKVQEPIVRLKRKNTNMVVTG
jgi:hypothetical protein